MCTPSSPPNQPPAGSPGKERVSKSPQQSPPPGSSPGAATETPLQWTAAPLDADETEQDHGYDDVASSTASLSSSVMQYRTIQGRTYHSNRGNAEYWGSNDEKQLESMDITHHAHTLLLGGKLCLAPIKDDIQKVVDIGTGTGLWAIDFADAYPNCEVIGTDLSPIQSTWVPPNCKFEIDDCSQPWTFEPDSIDFVHIRYLTGSIQDWPALFKEAYRCIKPGGYIQSFEATPWMESDDGTVAEDSAMAQWAPFFIEGGKMLGRTFTMIPDGIQRGGIEDAGFVDIQEADFKSPLGRWPKDPNLKEVGACTSAAICQDVEGYILYMATLQGWSKEEVLVYAARLRQEIRNPAIHAYYRMRLVWAKKPEA